MPGEIQTHRGPVDDGGPEASNEVGITNGDAHKNSPTGLNGDGDMTEKPTHIQKIEDQLGEVIMM